jgi:hypothetical protein
MNPTLQVLTVVAALLVSCGRSQIPTGVPADAGFPDADIDAGPGEDPIVEVSVGMNIRCTRSRGGKVVCDSTGTEGLRTRFTAIESGAKQISLGGPGTYCVEPSQVCALLEGGRVICTDGPDACSPGSREVRIAGVRSIAVGGYLSCALLETGQVVCSKAPLFEGALSAVGGMEHTTSISCGGWSCCALGVDGGVSCLALGEGGAAVPVPLPAGAVAVTVGDDHGCALDVTGHSTCWGFHAAALTPPGSGQAISAGSDVTCVLDVNGFAQCTLGNVTRSRFAVPLVQIDLGYGEICGLEAEGTLHCAEP